VSARSKAWVCGRSLARIGSSNPAGGMDVCTLWLLCRQVEVSATSWSLVQRSPTDYGESFVWSRNLKNEAMARVGLQRHRIKKNGKGMKYVHWASEEWYRGDKTEACAQKNHTSHGHCGLKPCDLDSILQYNSEPSTSSTAHKLGVDITLLLRNTYVVLLRTFLALLPKSHKGERKYVRIKGTAMWLSKIPKAR